MPSDIFYSPASGRFHTGESGQIVSNDTGIRSLIFDEEQQVYIDQRGRTISADLIDRQSFRSRDLTAYDDEGRPFISATVRSRLVSESDLQNIRPNANEAYGIRTVTTLPDGSVQITYTFGKQGEVVDLDKLQQQATGLVRKELESGQTSSGKSFELNSSEIKSRTVSTQFIKRTTVLR